MIKVGFICEGRTEKELIQSEKFQIFLVSIGIETTRVIDAEGNGNLLPHLIGQYIQILENIDSKAIVILTDLDKDACITLTKERLKARPNDVVIIAVKTIEAWFLACTPTMQKLLQDDNFEFQFPENETNPFETIRQLIFGKAKRGIGNGNSGAKTKLVYKLISLGLDINEAAQHPNCPSATYFINKLSLLAKQAQ